nr:uncharacterized protein LOC108385793 isoform X2 [Manis javanica]
MCESNGHRVVFIKMTLAPSQAKQDKQCRKVQRREQPPLPRPLPFTIPASRGQDFLLLCSLLSSQHLELPGTEPTLSRDHHPTLTFGASRLCTENFGEMKSYGEEVHRDIHVSLRAVSLLLETRRLGVGCAAVLPGPPCAASPPQALRISSCHSGTVSSVCLFMSYSHQLFSVRKQQVSGKLPSILAPVRTQLGPSWHFLPAPGPQQATSPRQFFPARPYPGRHLHSDLLPTRAQEPVGLPSEVQFEAASPRCKSPGPARPDTQRGSVSVGLGGTSPSLPRAAWVSRPGGESCRAIRQGPAHSGQITGMGLQLCKIMWH